jgi:hypothetical protein
MQVLRHSRRDSLLIALAFVHGALLLTAPSAPLIAIALWWNANTIAHNFIHLPFPRALEPRILRLPEPPARPAPNTLARSAPRSSR